MSPLFIVLSTFVPTAMLFFAMGIWYGARANREQPQPSPEFLGFPPAPKLPAFDEDSKADGQNTDGVEPESDDDDDPRDQAAQEQFEAAGYECQDVDEEDYESGLADEYNFAAASDDYTCRVCRTRYYPIRVWGTSKTQRQGMIGFFCRECGCGFTSTYSARNGSVTNEPSTVYGFLRPAPAKVIDLSGGDKSTPNIGGDTTL